MVFFILIFCILKSFIYGAPNAFWSKRSSDGFTKSKRLIKFFAITSVDDEMKTPTSQRMKSRKLMPQFVTIPVWKRKPIEKMNQ